MKTIRTIFPFISVIGIVATSCTPSPKTETGHASESRATTRNLVQYAKPLCGTAADGNLYPGATAPFGMIQWSPDTDAGLHCGGYDYANHHIAGFSLDHISGAGCRYGEDFRFSPLLGTDVAPPDGSRTAFAQTFSHNDETAKPGYYAVTLGNGVKVQLTATARSGFGRFTYPGAKPATMAINAASDVNGCAASGININPATHEVSGWSVGGHFCGKRQESRMIYFYAKFNRAFTAYSTWSDNTLNKGATNGTGTGSGAFLTFDTSGGRTVLAKVGISYVSVANAKANVEAEAPRDLTAAGFNKAVKAASEVWNRWLNKIQVSGGTTAQKDTFYSMLYHVLLGPVVVSDANGQYFGYDGKVHTTTDGRVQYGIFSGWDVYRSECQLLAMIAPKEASDMAQTLLVDYQQGGTFPRWAVITMDSGVMMGDPAAAMIPDFYTFGARSFDARAALKGLLRAATDPSVYAPRSRTHERDALADYLKLGYVPEHQRGGYGNVSMTLEYDAQDFALAQFAKDLGDETASAMLLKHAQHWQNLYNPKTGYLQMRRRDGSWAPGFRNDTSYYDGDTAYVEGSAAQYLWAVPFNLKGLAAKMGGPNVADRRLDHFFTHLNAGTRTEYCYLGNEPCLETPWEFCFWGEPYRTQEVVRQAMNTLYSAAPHGYPGNDDVGEMSSWYVFGALGMYPELPGSDVLVLGSPMFPKAVLHLPNGTVTIVGHGAAKDAPNVQSLTVNGQTWNKPWIRYADISHGGTLVYDLSAAPDTKWGSNLADAPPSYDGGISPTAK